jgi:hypothetical protein
VPIGNPSDKDGDGYLTNDDCDDLDWAINPGATEYCDGVDNNCDTNVDEGCHPCADGDTQHCGTDVGECIAGTQTCQDGQWGPCEGSTGPEAERCDGKDNDCDGLRDEDCPEPFPVLELHFEDGVPDSSPSSFDPRWEDGAGSYADGHDGRAAELDGSENGAYVLIEDDPRLCGMGLLTISVWAKKNSDAGGTILLKHVYYTLGVGADTIHAYVQTDEGGIDLNVYHFSDIQDTQWHHYAITYDSRTGLARLLVDGTEVQTGNGAGFVRYDPCDPRDLFIGKDPWGSTFDGLIDELVIHDAVTQ